ncbi:MAG: transcriptional regulator with XRE-family HTH domain [Reinekea sp.]|jgi:transcriptional regulator with XRE-family HTH domain
MRSSSNITQEQLADLANIDRGHMGHIERGTKSPSLMKVGQIAAALGVSITVLLTDL